MSVHLPRADTPRKQAAVILGKLLLIVTVVALVATSISSRHFQHSLCVNQNNAFGAVDQLIDHGVIVTQKRLKNDMAAGRNKAAQVDRYSLASSRVLRARITTIHC